MNTFTHGRYTMKSNGNSKDVYAFLLKWPTGNMLTLGAPIPGSPPVARLLGHQGSLNYKQTGKHGIVIILPIMDFSLMPCQWAWTFKLTSITN